MATLPRDAEPLNIENYYAAFNDPYLYKAWGERHATMQHMDMYLYRRAQHVRTGSEVFVMQPVLRILPPKRSPDSFSRPGEYLWQVGSLITDSVGDRTAEAIAECWQLAASLLGQFNETLGDKIKAADEARKRREEREREQRERYEREREERNRRWAEERERMRIEREKQRALQAARAKYLYDHVCWLLGDQIRLTRDGKRSTVFGTIDRVHPTGRLYVRDDKEEPNINACMEITTERGKYMRIDLRDVNKLEHKPDGERRFTLIYKTGMETTTEEGSKT